ncbi:MAG: hypothetical protein A2X36_03165 [Elusimicrobia bacterium GWA2_69_24]|nr:MAG: hypothetical protein A2X36_03165 [Elusimicrobia bacterium GWA2_69_24]HBL15234.1 hypothetical protein [Elusimicrobiota bacterium]
MRISCPYCSVNIAAQDVNIQAAVGKCAGCGAVFDLNELAGAAVDGSARKPAVSLPEGMSIRQDGSDLLLTRKWFSIKYLGLLFFCVFWDGFLVVWYTIAFTQGGPLLMKLFPMIHVAVGVGLTYTAVAGLLNRTFIRVNASELSVTHGPLPWPGKKVVRGDLDQLFCEEQVHHGKNGTTVTYTVSAVVRGGKRIPLAAGLDAPDQARFVEQEVERFLGIGDRPVTGELRS